MVNDPIAQMITSLKNASLVKKETVSLTYSGIKEAIAKVLVAEGYLKTMAKRKNSPILDLTVNFGPAGEPKIKDVKRISKLSCRVYKGYQDLHPARGGFCREILSTPKGILTDKQAKQEKVGGEVLFKIW